MQPAQPRWRTSPALATALVAVAFANGVASAWPFFVDDAYISLRYAARLLQGDGLTWTDGERVEGYSNLLWVLACAGLGGLGVPLPLAARGLGIAGSLAVLVLLVRRFRRSPAAFAVVTVAAAPAFAAWSIGGLEAPLLLALLTAALLALEHATTATGRDERRSLRRAGWLLAATAWTRPDAPLLPLALAATLFVGIAGGGDRPRAGRWFAVLTLPTAVAIAAQLLFRVTYYGKLLPNTASLKLGSGAEAFGAGLDYVTAAAWSMPGLVALAALGLVRPRGAHRPERPLDRTLDAALATAAAAWAGYLLLLGGDFMPAFRLTTPVLPLLAMLAGRGLERRAAAVDGRAAAAIVTGIAAVAAGLSLSVGIDHAHLRYAASHVWEDDGARIGRTLAAAFAPRRPLVAVDAAGAIPFFSELPALDMLGLADGAIARDGARGSGTPLQRAHTRGSPDYLLERAPDLVVFAARPCVAVPGDARGQQLVDDPRFVHGYRCTWLAAPADATATRTELLTPVWVAVHGRCGLRPLADGVEVPATLLGSLTMTPGLRVDMPADPGARPQWLRALARSDAWIDRRAVVVGSDHGAELEVRLAGELRLRDIPLPPGNYDIDVQPVPAGRVSLRDADDRELPRRGRTWVVAPDSGPLDLTLAIAPDQPLPLCLQTVTCRRTAAVDADLPAPDRGR